MPLAANKCDFYLSTFSSILKAASNIKYSFIYVDVHVCVMAQNELSCFSV